MPHITRLYSAHPLYLKQLQDQNLIFKNFREYRSFLEQDYFNWPNGLLDHLNKEEYTFSEFMINDRYGQELWANDFGIKMKNQNHLWQEDIATKQLIEEQTEILFCDALHSLSHKWLSNLSKTCPKVKLKIAWCGAPFQEIEKLYCFDLVLTCIPELRDFYQSKGLNCEYLKHGFDPRILQVKSIKQASKIYNFTFIGQIYRSSNYHQGRWQLIREIIKHTDLLFFGPINENKRGLKIYTNTKLKQLLYDLNKHLPNLVSTLPESINEKVKGWSYRPELPYLKELAPIANPAVFGLEMFKVLKRSQITLNNHIDASPLNATNMRLFEATGIGTCLLTDHKSNLHHLFIPDKEIITYKTPSECISKYKWLIDNPVKRNEIARAAQQRVLKDHSFQTRAKELNQLIKAI